MWSKLQHLVLFLPLIISLLTGAVDCVAGSLFGYQESARDNMELFPQWRSVLERHIRDLSLKKDCSQGDFEQCKFVNWLKFLDQIKGLPEIQKIQRVNEFVNKGLYVLDRENYGIEDYWATPREFLLLNGDCEDYAITKMLSLERIGVDVNRMRVVVVQDTNLRIPHAVMSVDQGKDILILDNQIKEVISHKYIYHYVPVYSINEKSWWMHIPN